MNKNVHDTDDFFRSAYKQFEEDPSPVVWEKINSKLEKRNSDSNYTRLKSLKRVLILLVLLQTGFALFDSNSFKSGSAVSNDVVLTKRRLSIEPGVLKNDKINVRKNAKEKISILLDEKLNAQNQLRDNYQTADPSRNKVNSQDRQQVFDNLIMEQKQLTVIPPPGAAERTSPIIATDAKKRPVPQTGYPFIPNALSKNSNAQKERKHSFTPFWSMNAFFSYDMVNYRLDSDIPNYITSIKHSEVHEPSFSFGILLSRKLTSELNLQTGLVFSTIAIGINPQKMYAFQDPQGDFAYKFITSSGYAFIKPGFRQPPNFGDSLTSAEAKHTLNSIGIPLVAKFQIGKNKLTLLPGAGIEANFITSAKVEVEFTDEFNRETVSINKLSGSKPFYLSTIAEVELRYKLNEKLSVSLHPAFRYAISPITENNVVETYPYSLGIRAGITRKF